MSNLGKKVLLTAFNGRLMAEPIEWPEDKIGQDIWLIMDMEKPSVERDNQHINIYETTAKRCRFEFSGGFHSSGDMPAIYKLVEVV